MATQSRPPIVDDPRTYEIIGAAMEVHRELGPGFAEPVYQAALTNEFLRRDIPFAREVPMRVEYKGDRLEVNYCADFLCYDEIIVELKAIPKVTGREYAQVRNYLHVSDKKLGMILNFGCKKLDHRRVEPYPIEEDDDA
jgi:GxxExxY protein